MNLLNHHITEHDPDKPYLVLLHGLFGNLDNLAVVRRELANSHNVISIDLPDHGQSAHSQRFDFEHYAAAVLATVAQHNIDVFALLGHSLGGKVAMKMALGEPQKVSHLIVADIAPVAYQARHQTVFAALNAVPLATLSGRSEASTVMQEYLQEPGVAQFLLKSLYQHDGNWQWRFNLSMLQRDYPLLSAAIESSKAYPGPTLFIKGGRSDYLLAEHKSVINTLFPNSAAKVIGSAGHWLHAEKPQIFNRLVSEFLTNKQTG